MDIEWALSGVPKKKFQRDHAQICERRGGRRMIVATQLPPVPPLPPVPLFRRLQGIVDKTQKVGLQQLQYVGAHMSIRTGRECRPNAVSQWPRYALTEELKFRGGDILDHNFDTYEIPRFSGVPRIECLFVKNEDLAPWSARRPLHLSGNAPILNASPWAC